MTMNEQTYYKNSLTNEMLYKGGISPFEVVKRAIAVAQHIVKAGKDVETNVAYEVIQKMADDGIEAAEAELSI
jgi:hypothetical protein